MATRQIAEPQWRPFLENLGRERRAWLATLELNGVMHAHDEPLTRISAADGVEIHIGKQAIRLGHPRAVSVEETDGSPQALRIEDASGQIVILRFRVAAAPGALDGLAPAERS